MWLVYSANYTCKRFEERKLVSTLKCDFKMLCSLCIFLGHQDLTISHCRPCRHVLPGDMHRTCMYPWRSRPAEHYSACVSAGVVCSWQTYCTSVKMQAATSMQCEKYVTILSCPSLIITYNSTEPSLYQHAIPYPCCFSGKHCPVMDSWAFELQQCAVTVTIIQTLEDWRVIELCPVMEFLHLCIWKLKFTFAYCKWCLIYLQHVRMVSTVLSFSNTFTIS